MTDELIQLLQSMQSKQYVTRTCEKGEICDAMIQ